MTEVPAARPCGLYSSGHEVHWLQVRLSTREPGTQILGRITGVARGVITLATESGTREYRNHDTARLRALIRDWGPDVVVDVPTARRDRLTLKGTLLGTPDYLAPEVIRGQVADERADLYATGVVLFEALSHRFGLQAFRILFQGRNIGRRNRRTNTHDLLQNPLAADYRRGTVGERCD